MRLVKSAPQHQSKAFRLTQKWYKTVINTYDVVLIAFYCEWCPGERKGDFGPEFDKAANIIHNLYPRKRHEKGQAILLKVNCSDEKVLADMFNVWCYPTYKVVKNGEIIQDSPFLPWRNTENFLQLIEQYIDVKKAREPQRDLSILPIGIYSEKLTLKNYKEVIKQCDLFLLFFYAPWYQSCRDALKLFEEAHVELTKEYQSYLYRYYKKNPEICFGFGRMEAGRNGDVIKKFGIRKYPTFKYFKCGRLCGEYQWDGTKEGFIKFIQNEERRKKLGKEKKRSLNDNEIN